MSIKSLVGIILILFGIVVAVHAYSTAAVTGGLNMSVVEPAEALLAYEVYPVTLVAGHTVTTTIPLELYNQLPDAVEIDSLSIISAPGIQVHSFSPAYLPASEQALLQVTYVVDMVGGQYPVTHRLMASSTNTDVEIMFDVDVTVLNRLTVDATPVDAGTVDGSGTYLHNSTAIVAATPNTCYTFSRWDGDVPASQVTDNPLNLIMDTNKELTAIFVKKQYTLTADASEGGSVEPSGSTTYDCGTTVTVTATPEDGYRFSGWDGDVSGDAQTTISIYDDTRVAALFEPLSDTAAEATPIEQSTVEEEHVD